MNVYNMQFLANSLNNLPSDQNIISLIRPKAFAGVE